MANFNFCRLNFPTQFYLHTPPIENLDIKTWSSQGLERYENKVTPQPRALFSFPYTPIRHKTFKMDTAQPVATTMTTDISQQTNSQAQDEQVLRLRGGGICTDCLA